MQPQTPPPPPPTITISDVYHVLFKHKWTIIICSALGLGVAAAFYFLTPVPYTSEAKLLVRYVEEPKALAGPSGEAQVTKPLDLPGTAILAAEADILTSLDVAVAVVDAVGIEKIMGKGAGTNRDVAALTLRRNLNVDVPKVGNVLKISYQDSDFTVVQPVLRKLIETYYKKHVEYHKNPSMLDEFLTQETDQLRSRLTQTEEDLHKLKVRAGVVSLEETRKAYADRYLKLRQELDATEAELSERVAAVNELQKSALVEASAKQDEAVTNAPPKTKLPADVISEYKFISSRLEEALRDKTALLKSFTPENARVKENQTVIASLVAQKKEMEAANPRLIEEEIASSRSIEHRSGIDLVSENARVAALQARLKTLTAQFDKIKADAGAVDDIETQYLALQRKKEQEESLFRSYSRTLDQARVDSQLGAGKLSNISEIQSPSMPLRDTKPLRKSMMMAAGGGIFGGIALAFLIEFAISQTVRKPSELENHLNLPVFLTIPILSALDRRNPIAALKRGPLAALPEKSSANGDGGPMEIAVTPVEVDAHTAPQNGSEIPPWDENHTLHPYSEGLRDRLVTFFEAKGLTHKPKLIALTSCSRKAGVTTLAAGLAASLSETGEGNVLLVDMNLDRAAAHPFYRGKPACGLADLLEDENTPTAAAYVQENLYMVRGTTAGENIPKMLPKRLAHLLPKLQASDYDYIIFDMPPVTQTSVTPRLAGFMDMVFLVVEGEKTNRDWLKHATGLLKQSKTNVAAVFNKRRDYTPRWLHQEF